LTLAERIGYTLVKTKVFENQRREEAFEKGEPPTNERADPIT